MSHNELARAGMAGRWPAIAAALSLWLIAGSVLAQHALVTRFKPDLPLFPQYFSVAQGVDGMVYLGHDTGILRFDGNRWERIEVAALGPVRVMKRDANGRIWVGGTNTFGFLQREETGVDRFVNLSAQFEAELDGERFADVWRMLVTPDAVYIGALRHLFAVSPDGKPLGLWRNDGRFGGMARVGSQVWVQWRGQGLKRQRPDGSFEMLPGGEQFAAPLLNNIVALSRQSALLHSTAPALHLWQQNRFSALQVADPGATTHLVAAQRVDDSTVVFSGADGAIRVLDVTEGRFETARIANDYLTDVVIADDGALLVASDRGVLRLPWPATWLRYGADVGVNAALHGIHQMGNQLYLLSGSGVYQATLDNGGLASDFSRMDWAASETWNLLDTGAGLLLADAHGLRNVSRDGAPRVGPDDLYPRSMLLSKHHPGRLWTGNEHGLSVFELVDGRWQLQDRLEEMGMRVLSLVEREDGLVWLGTDNHGLYEATLGEDGLATIRLQQVEEAGESGAEVARTRHGVWVSTPEKTLTWNGERFVTSPLEGLDELKPGGEMVRFFDGSGDDVWAISYRALYRLHEGLWSMTDLARLDAGAFGAASVAGDGGLWIGANSALFHYRPTAATARTGGSMEIVSLRAAGAGQADQALPIGQPLELAGLRVNIHAQMQMTDLEQAGSTFYRSRLLGLDEAWSPWRPQAEVSYLGLGPGDYTLEVESRSGTGQIIQASPQTLSVVPMWYQTAAFRFAVVGLLAGLLLWLVTAFQRRKVDRLARRNMELDQVVKARTEDLRRANEKLRLQAERDPLTGVGNRRLFNARLMDNFDAAAESSQGLALLLVDVDHFKQYNDTHGHQAGDVVLAQIARVLSDNVRDDTTVARYGGEEFGIVVPRCDALSAARLARRLVEMVASEVQGLTVSIGVAAYDAARDDDPDLLLGRTDEALYSAKRQGRNRFILAA